MAEFGAGVDKSMQEVLDKTKISADQFESVDLIPFQILLLVLLIMFQTVEMASLMLLNTELAVETIAFHKLDK
ncbi:hypothetical protein ACUN90_30595 [Escherichia sp. SP-MK2]